MQRIRGNCDPDAEVEVQTFNPCKNLWLSVLIQAIREACLPKGGKEQRQAMKWLECREQPPETGDVLWICQHTGFGYLSAYIQIIKYGTDEDRAEIRRLLT